MSALPIVATTRLHAVAGLAWHAAAACSAHGTHLSLGARVVEHDAVAAAPGDLVWGRVRNMLWHYATGPAARGPRGEEGPNAKPRTLPSTINGSMQQQPQWLQQWRR